MNGQNKNNLKELFERFVSTEEAESGVEDIVNGERILEEYPAPEPDTELIAAIKSDIAETLRLRKEHTFRRLAYRLAPVAAVLIILASVSIKLYVRDSRPEGDVWMMPPAVWDSENVAADDMDLAVFTAEVDQLEIEFTTLERAENGGNGQSDVSELEMDFVAISNDIWEG